MDQKFEIEVAPAINTAYDRTTLELEEVNKISKLLYKGNKIQNNKPVYKNIYGGCYGSELHYIDVQTRDNTLSFFIPVVHQYHNGHILDFFNNKAPFLLREQFNSYLRFEFTRAKDHLFLYLESGSYVDLFNYSLNDVLKTFALKSTELHPRVDYIKGYLPDSKEKIAVDIIKTQNEDKDTIGLEVSQLQMRNLLHELGKHEGDQPNKVSWYPHGTLETIIQELEHFFPFFRFRPVQQIPVLSE